MALKSISRFNAEQRKVFNEVVGALMPGLTTSAIDEEPSNEAPTEWLLILDTPGETGKTFVTSSEKRFLNATDKNILADSLSSVSTQLLDDARTAHSALQILIPTHQDRTCTMSADSSLVDSIRNINLLTWDDVVVSLRHNPEAIERTFRDVTRSTLPFGGKQCF